MIRKCYPGLILVLLLLPSSVLASDDVWRLTWRDEFDGPGLDASKWTCVVGGNGFGNHELEYYTDRPENVSIDDGILVIKAIQETYTGTEGITRGFTSARLHTREKFSQAYGRFEARIRLPRGGPGIWPAFWLLGDGSEIWPNVGEIDVLEAPNDPSVVYGTAHGPGYSGAHGIGGHFRLPKGNRPDDFHLYAIEWDREIRWYVDDKLFKTVTPSDLPPSAPWVFDHPFHIILNLAVGGDWPGPPTKDTAFPQSMYIDYVRVYQRKTGN
jgi:beta-glucanase (GH16 family)